MPDIQILSPHLADLIAAGEVVERPASVVKELVENAFDAGARTVTVELRGGGATYLRVTDDGCGMTPEDAGIAFLRHATSKLHDAQGLEAIGTMGFRGEALAAISAVSHITLTTRRRGAPSGTHMTLDAGEIQDMYETGCPEGTTMIVRDLFYNTPARRKFLKTDRAEGAACAAAALRCALGRPDVSVRCIRDGEELFFSPGDNKLDSCVYSLLGRELAKTLLPCEGEVDGVRVHGFISSPLRRARQPRAAAFLLQRTVDQIRRAAGRARAGLPQHTARGTLSRVRAVCGAQLRGRGRERPPGKDRGEIFARTRGVRCRVLRCARSARGRACPGSRRTETGSPQARTGIRARAQGRPLPARRAEPERSSRGAGVFRRAHLCPRCPGGGGGLVPLADGVGLFSAARDAAAGIPRARTHSAAAAHAEAGRTGRADRA